MNKEQGPVNNLLYTLFGFEKGRGTTQIALIILIHALAWGAFFLIPLLFYPVRFESPHFFITEILGKVLPVALFYLNYFFLLPRLFERKKYLIYFLLVFIAILLATVQDIVLHENAWKRRSQLMELRLEQSPGGSLDSSATSGNFFPPNDRLPRDTQRFFLHEPRVLGMPRGIMLMAINKTVSLSLVLLLIGGLIRLGFLFIKNQHEKRLLENANLNAEVNFLKSQINPHFLFNTLNGIYSQAHDKSDKTEISILKLSDLLRYMLYDSGEDRVELAKDIQYITNYIDLQRLRLSSKINIEYDVQGKTEGHLIAPLLLIPFIENAFKHGISYTHPSVIKIKLTFFEETLTLHIENPLVESNSFGTSGLGLKNVIRRLDLLYPGKYKLDIGKAEKLYIVDLKIVLSD
jgi:two-component system, LytTR family, sensor kinase